jgi:hypothetical protein
MTAEAKYDMTVYPTAGLVRSASASDGAKSHQVTLPSCDCADFINRKGWVIEVDGVSAVTICKHIAEFIERVGGWNRPAEEVPKLVIYPVVTRGQAVTVLTSHYIASELTNRLLLAACGADGMWVTVGITTGQLSACYDKASRRYSVRVPAAQPLHVPTGASAFPVAQHV